MNVLGLVSVLAAATVAGQATCPYASTDASVDVLTAGSIDVNGGGYCSPGTVFCRVNGSCKEVWNSTDPTKYKVAGVRRLGDMSRYAQAALIVQNCTIPITFDPLFKLPVRLNTFGIENCRLLPANFPKAMQWPSTLNELYLGENKLDAAPTDLPSKMAELWLNDNSLTELPRTPVVTLVLNVERNFITELVGLYDSLSQAKRVLLSGNPITRIVNVTFNPDMTVFKCGGCAITTFHLSKRTLNALNVLGPYVASTDTGFLVASVSFNATSCNAVQGSQTLLLNQYPVCVTDMIAFPPTVLPTPQPTPTSQFSYHTVVWPTLLVVLAIAGGVFVCRRRRSNTKGDDGISNAPNANSITAFHGLNDNNSSDRHHSSNAAATATSTVHVGVPYAFTVDTVSGTRAGGQPVDPLAALAPWQVEQNEITYKHVLAKGAWGEVWLGEYANEAVAIKKLLPHRQADVRAQLLFVEELKLLGRLTCPHIVQLRGVAWSSLGEVQGVIEFMDQCDLASFLQRTNPMSFNWTDKLKVVANMASALAYLHSVQIIHRDFKSKNVLLDSRKGAKLADFGVSRDQVFDGTMTAGVGTPRWTAPEVLAGRNYTVAADVYSFGIVLGELDSHTLPFSLDRHPETGGALTASAIVTLVTQGKLIPSFSPTCPPFVRDLALCCVASSPDLRPTANQIVLALSQHVEASMAT